MELIEECYTWLRPELEHRLLTLGKNLTASSDSQDSQRRFHSRFIIAIATLTQMGPPRHGVAQHPQTLALLLSMSSRSLVRLLHLSFIDSTVRELIDLGVLELPG